MDTVIVDAHSLAERLARVRGRIGEAAAKAGRAAQEVRLIAVSKAHPHEVLRAAIAAGAMDLGENRVQEAEGKIAALGREAVSWHLIGHLQENKARKAVQLFDLIHSLDAVKLALRLDRICGEEGRAELSVLAQVDLGGEVTKTGVSEDELPSLMDALAGCKHLRLRGLMTLPPYFEEAEQARPFFRRLRELRDEWQRRGAFGNSAGELSMGMSHDFEVAIAEGATMVRVGTAIFGERFRP
jgi:hypothetical protein